jgi:superfamily II DNA or RNA helicase/HKD family nuclease
MPLSEGLYDILVTDTVARALADAHPDTVTTRDLDHAEAADRLAEVLALQMRRILADMEDGDAEGLRTQLELVNGLLRDLRGRLGTASAEPDLLPPPPRVLNSVHRAAARPHVTPETGLATPWLFTAGRGSPALLNELRREAAACDSIDILISFITVAGVRKLIDVLRAVTAADAAGRGRTRIRVLTTTYTGATEVRALDELARLNGCEVRVSFDGRRTRLHAKAWIFHRATGFGSAYVGSANLSGAALMGGLEWTVKFTERGQGSLFQRAKAHFDTLWLDEEFTPYHPDDAEVRDALRAALRQARGDEGGATPLAFFDIQPKPFQREMLAELERERERRRTRNLLVAATGTGKTVVAALDYRDTCRRLGHRPRLLFVAHRAQILRQAQRTYREVLRDHTFGEMLGGGAQHEGYEYLFATIDSLATQQLVEQLGADFWHTVVIDECHRLAGKRFHQLATTIRPAHLLGLTATPERTDGVAILPYFDPRPDRSPAVELRLWDALDMQLLAPFEYYACDDPTDFSEVRWDQPGETAAVDARVTGNTARARMVVNEWHRLAADPRRARALVFCVSVAHARFMAEFLTESGLPALAVTGQTPMAEQRRAPERLRSGEVCALVTVDLYNEGVDIPEVDTLLLLRPTQSPVLFQQQIGRGLRLVPGKESCLVLDFVGQHRAEFRFDRLFSAITGLSRRQLIEAVQHGFTDLAPGCHIHLERQTRQQVLRNLQVLTRQTWARLRAELQAFAQLRGPGNVTLGDFLHEQMLDLDEIYRDSGRSGWTALRRDAGLLPGAASEEESRMSARLGALLHVDDPRYLRLIREAASAGDGTASDASLAAADGDGRRAQMLTYQLLLERAATEPRVLRERLHQHPACAEELAELAELLLLRSRVDPTAIPGAEDVPLCLHGAYQLREILSAFGFLTADRYTPFRAGVLPLKERKLELLFVTLDKSSGFHERISYHDYAVSPSRFHWQTQNAAGPDTPAGRRYLESATNGWRFHLFVRVRKGDPYRACGPVYLADPADIKGDRPMNIEWTLEVPLPPHLFSRFSVLRG